VAFGFNFGHVDHNFTFPVGGQVRVNFDSGKIDLLEQMVL
jgi:muramoyltetrapeptide carboxypeptidase LdcA involved in peptidoglycan recycling